MDKRAEQKVSETRASIAELKLAIENTEKEQVVLSDRRYYYLRRVVELERILDRLLQSEDHLKDREKYRKEPW